MIFGPSIATVGVSSPGIARAPDPVADKVHAFPLSIAGTLSAAISVDRAELVTAKQAERFGRAPSCAPLQRPDGDGHGNGAANEKQQPELRHGPHVRPSSRSRRNKSLLRAPIAGTGRPPAGAEHGPTHGHTGYPTSHGASGQLKPADRLLLPSDLPFPSSPVDWLASSSQSLSWSGCNSIHRSRIEIQFLFGRKGRDEITVRSGYGEQALWERLLSPLRCTSMEA